MDLTPPMIQRRLGERLLVPARLLDAQGFLHSVDEPVLTTAKEVVWFKHGLRHRDGGPATTWYHDNGQIWLQEWLIDGVLHREDGPAVIWYETDGQVSDQYYDLYGIPLKVSELKDLMSRPCQERLMLLATKTKDYQYFAGLLRQVNPEAVRLLEAVSIFMD